MNQIKDKKQQTGQAQTNNTQNTSKMFSELIVLKRVAKVTSGGKRLRFTAVAVVGDGAGKVGLALAHGKEAPEAIKKAMDKAKTKMVEVPMDTKSFTVPMRIEYKYRSARVMMKPAPAGVGIVAGGTMRKVLSVAGYKNVVAKRIGDANPIATAYATILALYKIKEKVLDV